MKKEAFYIDSEFTQKALFWAAQHTYVIALNNLHPNFPLGGFPNVLAISDGANVVYDRSGIIQGKDYYGFVSYDYKNYIEPLRSENQAYIHFPDFFFFEPEILLEFEGDHVTISAKLPTAVFEAIKALQVVISGFGEPISVKALTSRDLYLQQTKEIIEHIHKGNIYEVNYCMGFFAADTAVDAVRLYQKLGMHSPTPFACFVKCQQQYLMCASPERYFKLKDRKVISQPIKGTGKVKDVQNVELELKRLQESAKERNENVMIVDLVRNDLSKVCIPGTVKVDELFGVYRFGNLYQMISTISGALEADKWVLDVMEASFPMGSMTGAPKYRSMQLIESYENFKRNIYSGTVGYIKANGDADFNVVIRSLFYDQVTQKLSFAVGSGITSMSDPHQEYDECLLKAENMIKVLATEA